MQSQEGVVLAVCFGIGVFTKFNIDRKNKPHKKLSREEQRKLKQQYIYKGKSLAFYDTITRGINIVMHNRNDLFDYAEGINNHTGSALHRAGFHVTAKRSIKSLQKMLPGFEKIQTVDDFYSRIISHESIHKALDGIGELKACMEFDNIHV